MRSLRRVGSSTRDYGAAGEISVLPVTPEVGIVGLGLIGGSLARLLAAQQHPVTGWDADPATRSAAESAGIPVADSLAALAAGSGVIFVAVPLPALDEVLAALAADVLPGTVISDTTSVKVPPRALAAAHDLTFIGGHPMAGTAESGFAAGSAELLAGATWALTLDEESGLPDWLRVAGLLTDIGCPVLACTSADHDQAVATISHLPHLLAAALTGEAAGNRLAWGLAAGSFRDATRVAGTRGDLVAAMCGGNADAVDVAVDRLISRLVEARAILRQPEELALWFATAAELRRAWPAPPPEPGATYPVGAAGLRERLLALGAAGGRVTAVGVDRVSVSGGTAVRAFVDSGSGGPRSERSAGQA